MSLLKRVIALSPETVQEDLKRFHFRRQIKRGAFITDEPEYAQLSSYVHDGDWVIDVGANIGHYTTKLSELVGSSGRVIAFEPVPTTLAHLAHNVLCTGRDNVTLLNAAASDTIAAVAMSIPNFQSGLKNYYQASITAEADENATSVLTIPIDALQIPHRVSLIKIDAEEHEPEVIRGALQLIQRDKPTLIVETVTDDIRKQLKTFGYTERSHENSPNCLFVVEKH